MTRQSFAAFCLAVVLLVAAACFLTSCGSQEDETAASSSNEAVETVSSTASAPSSTSAPAQKDDQDFLAELPAYAGNASVEVNGNKPTFTEEELGSGPFETYSQLDSLGRCGPAFALIGPETMPEGKRESIGMIKPSGWQTVRYDWVDGGYLFNRCHLIAFMLAGENDNELNLITGTRTMNVQGMLPYEEKVASYVEKTGKHVLYRVTPVFESSNLVATGVLMEAQSTEDGGAGVSFCVWCFNVEPGVIIDYATGNNQAGDPLQGATSLSQAEPSSQSGVSTGARSSESTTASATQPEQDQPSSTANETASAETRTYVLNTNTHKFHYPDCQSVSDMKEKNKKIVEGTRDEIIADGYSPCGRCNP